jgi:uncharacterized protein YegL
VTSTLPLILSKEPVTRGMLNRMKVSTPDIAVVYADAFGHVASFDGRPLSWAQQVLTKYRTRYEVDLSDHRRTAQLDSSPLPSHGDTYFFKSTVDVGFRVTDPEAVVSRNVTDALVVVYNHLIDSFRPITRRHDISDAAGAEAQLNLLYRVPVALDEGITIYRCTTRLLPDAAAQNYLRSLTAADRTLEVNEAEHKVSKAATAHHVEIDAMTQDARLTAESKEMAALAGRRVDLQSLILTHLSKHPDQTDYALELLHRHELAQAAHRDINDQRSMDLARYMMEQGLIQSVDIELLRKETLTRVQQIASPSAPELTTASSWDQPLPGDPPPVLSLPAPAAEPAIPAIPAARADVASAIPVYVAVDESPADPGYLGALNKGIQALPAGLAGHPEVISAIRLGVLGYAGDVKVRMPLNTVAADSFVPELAARDGANLAAVLDDLRERISDDIGRLKDRGLTVGRPTVYLLSAAASRDETAWDAALRRLAERAAFPYAPNILALGIGAAPAEVIVRIAERPGSRGWVALPGLALSDAAESYMAFVRKSIISLGRAHVTGRNDTDIMEQPERFRPVGDRT